MWLSWWIQSSGQHETQQHKKNDEVICTLPAHCRWAALPQMYPWGADKGPLQDMLQSNQSCSGWERWSVSNVQWPAHSRTERHSSCQVTSCLHWPAAAKNTWKTSVWEDSQKRNTQKNESVKFSSTLSVKEQLGSLTSKKGGKAS